MHQGKHVLRNFTHRMSAKTARVVGVSRASMHRSSLTYFVYFFKVRVARHTARSSAILDDESISRAFRSLTDTS